MTVVKRTLTSWVDWWSKYAGGGGCASMVSTRLHETSPQTRNDASDAFLIVEPLDAKPASAFDGDESENDEAWR